MPASPRFGATTLMHLLLPPMMWAGNAVLGHLMVHSLPPVAMNAWRWLIVAALLLPWSWRSLLESAGAVRSQWGYLAALGVLGVGCYNALQYMALHTSSPLNATLIGTSVPVWMMLVGAFGFGQPIHKRQCLGALLSSAGVLLVVTQGHVESLRQVQWVAGDALMLLASLVWAVYSWMLTRPPVALTGPHRPAWSWLSFLQIQVLFGLIWAGGCSAVEASLAPVGQPSAWPASLGTWAALLFIALGPSIVAYRGWGLGVQAVGPTMAAFFGNLTPLFAALWSALFLGQRPSWYHPVALALVMAGIAVSSRPRPSG